MEQYTFGNRYNCAHLSKLDQSDENMKILSNWVSDPKKILFFHGNVGTGKTYFCAALYNSLMEKQVKQRKDLSHNLISFRAFSEQNFFNHLKNVIQMNSNAVAEIYRLCEADYIIFDDFGSSKMTEWQIEMLSEFIDLRYSSEKPTVITSNMDRNSVKSLFPLRVYDRLFSKGNVIIEQNECSRR